jgi:hypothetical protein
MFLSSTKEECMAQVQRRNLDSVDVFEDGPHADFLIASADVPNGVKNNAAIYDKLKPLTLRDLFHVVGFRHGGDDLSSHVKALNMEDIHALGRCFKSHLKDMGYPDKVFSCCCCG